MNLVYEGEYGRRGTQRPKLRMRRKKVTRERKRILIPQNLQADRGRRQVLK